MAISSSLIVSDQQKGIEYELTGIYSRYQKTVIDAFAGVSLFFLDYASKEAAAKVLLPDRVSLPFDRNNPDHVRLWELAGKHEPEKLDGEGNLWKINALIQKWDGRTCAKEPIQEREVKLPQDIALALLAGLLQGEMPREPKDAAEKAISQAYLAALATGEFQEAVTV